MSSDEIFAAQMWTWPGPMMKRDPSGRVIIVNAAFLQLYGGGVENWAGNPITGWPAPQPPGQSTRFESRIPQADGTEIIYDWLETSLSDGSALSIARDVTMFAAQAVQPPVAAAPPAQEAQYQTPPAQELPQDQFQTQQQTQQFAETPPAQAPVQQTPAEPPAAETPPAEQAPQAAFQSSSDFLPQEPPAEVDVSQMAPPSAGTEAQSEQEPSRDFERRALPMEDSGAVLGNNWRDAVIAKAVGVDETGESGESPSGGTQIVTTPEPEKTAPGTVRILLAEDNAINALLTRTLLEAEGCHVEVVEDGALAVEAMKNATYDMIFMDMRMPNMDGLEATRKIRAMDHRSKGLPIVALTANAFDDDRNACFDSGMNDFMTKPVSAEELSEMVKIHTSRAEEKMAS